MDTLDRVRRIVARELELEAEEIRPEKSIMRDLGADSLAMMQIAMAVEEEFGIAVEDNELDSLVTVRAIVRAVEDKLKRSGSLSTESAA